MLLAHVLFSALLLLSDAPSSSAKAILRSNHLRNKRSSWNDMLKVSAEQIEHTLFPREAEAVPVNEITSRASSTDGTANSSAACLAAVSSSIENATNPAGIVACYDIPDLNTTTGVFHAELHMYQLSRPSGSFAGINVNDIISTMSYASGAAVQQMKTNVRRDTSSNDLHPLPVKYIYGQLDKSMNLSVLNTTELISLLLPTISLSAVSPQTQTLISTNLTTSDIAFFPTGIFSTSSSPQTSSSPSIISASSPSLLAEAESKASAAADFVLPGTTLGIFPTGLIVTGSWTVLFLLAYGFGTVSRIQHRRQYRQRIANPRRRRGGI